MSRHFRLRSASVTHAGLVRSQNEDSLLARDDAGVWAVADGMGGHVNGQWASSEIVAELSTAALVGEFDADLTQIAAAIQSANHRIFSAGQERSQSMGSTIVTLYISGDCFSCFWVGDSRVYLLRDEQLHRMTRDHTKVQEMVSSGLLSEAEAHNHPMSHVLSRAVGVEPEVEIEAVSDMLQPRDLFLLCSDGLSGVVSDAEIVELLVRHDAGVACEHLLELVLERGAPDNVTMIAVSCEEATALMARASLSS